MKKLVITLSSPQALPSIYWGSVLHGILMQLLPEPYPELLHSNDARSLSMYVRVKQGNQFDWILHCVSDELSDAIASVLHEGMTLFSRNQNLSWKILSVTQGTTALSTYMERIFTAAEPAKGIAISLFTPTTHKSAGRYSIFPTVELISANLRKHLITAFPELPFGEDDVMEDMLSHCYISRYNLRSATYNLEGHYVPGYTGKFEIHFEGPDALKRLSETFFSFAEWCGIGAKTALGMGGCEIERIEERGTRK